MFKLKDTLRCNINLHGVEHAHQSCEAETDCKHGLHAHLQTETHGRFKLKLDGIHFLCQLCKQVVEVSYHRQVSVVVL